MEYPTLINWNSPFPFLRLLDGIFIFLFKIIITHFVSNSGDPDQTPRFVASDLGLHCLPMHWQQKGRLFISSFPASINCS